MPTEHEIAAREVSWGQSSDSQVFLCAKTWGTYLAL